MAYPDEWDDVLKERDQLKAENDKQKIAIANQGKIINQYQKQSTDLQYELDTIKNNPEAEKYYFERWTELKQRIAELEQERRWIPVSERLPEKNGFYYLHIHSDGGRSYERVGTFFIDGYFDVLCDKVTHWKHLPQPQKEGE